MKIAGLLRVKNEARWIGRVIDSIKELCNAGVFILDNHSTDDTQRIARERGARIFMGAKSFDETRDNNELVKLAMLAENPDWLLRIDGDEELEAGGVEILRAAILSGAAPCYELRSPFLWDREDQVRIDRWYSQRWIPSLFTTRGVDLTYPETKFGNAGGKNMHCPRVPGQLETKALRCGARLIHYGYLDRETRIRKFTMLNSIDPENDYEDRYRHIVQGDIGAVPADAELKWAGPLELAPFKPASRAIAKEKDRMKPTFTVIHPTARPDKWRAIYEAWQAAATDSYSFEYILVCDKRWGFEKLPELTHPIQKAVWNTGRRCYVDAVNIGAQYATGDVLIVTADDQFPCQDWDFHLAEVLADSGKEVIEVSTGTPKEHERGILVLPILTRQRYERLGYLLYPEYESMFSDNDFCEMARRDDQVADATHLLFPHKHPFFDPSLEIDEALKQQNRPEAYQLGAAVFAQRKQHGFGSPKRKRIMVCMPGEVFSRRWIASTMQALQRLQMSYEVVHIMGYCSNVFQARASLALEALSMEAEYVLWIDDDNVVESPDIQTLINDLEAHQELDVVVGWCCCHSDGENSPIVNTSVGFFSDEIRQASITPEQLHAARELIGIDWTGFPIVLMRQNVLRKLGKPFQPVPNEHSTYGFDSEDVSFSRHLKEAGLKMAVDPRVKVPHLKLRDTNGDVPATAGILKGEQ